MSLPQRWSRNPPERAWRNFALWDGCFYTEERCLKYFRCLEEFSVVKISKDDEIIITDKFHCCSTNIAIVILVPGSQGLQPRAFWANPKMADSDLLNKLSVLLYIKWRGKSSGMFTRRWLVTLASDLTLAGGQMIVRVYKQHITGRVVPLQLRPMWQTCPLT